MYIILLSQYGCVDIEINIMGIEQAKVTGEYLNNNYNITNI